MCKTSVPLRSAAATRPSEIFTDLVGKKIDLKRNTAYRDPRVTEDHHSLSDLSVVHSSRGSTGTVRTDEFWPAVRICLPYRGYLRGGSFGRRFIVGYV